MVYRLLPRRNEEVNQIWMCDEGRLSYHPTNEKRVRWARTGRGDDRARRSGRASRVERAAELLRPLAGQGSVGIALSAQCTNEEATAAFQIGKQLRASRYFLGSQPAGDSDDFLIRADKNPNTQGRPARRRGVRGEAGGRVPASTASKRWWRCAPTGCRRRSWRRWRCSSPSPRTRTPPRRRRTSRLPCESVYEQDGTLINWYGRLQRTWDSVPAPVGDAAPGWSWAKRLLDGLGGVGPTTAARGVPHAGGEVAAPPGALAGTASRRRASSSRGCFPREWPARAPRPTAGAHPVRGPQTTPPGMKVGDEASGGSR